MSRLMANRLQDGCAFNALNNVSNGAVPRISKFTAGRIDSEGDAADEIFLPLLPFLDSMVVSNRRFLPCARC
uniref:Uncharacterized protein n=1 Tax=Leersia perrieri TaxID=77586 RepID=A0A0D9WKB5_9ORYZ